MKTELRPRLVPFADAMREIGWHPKSGYRLARLGQSPLDVVRIGRSMMVRRDDLEALIAGEQPHPATPLDRTA